MAEFVEKNKHADQLEALRLENERLRALVRATQRNLDTIHRSTSWRLTSPLRLMKAATSAFWKSKRGGHSPGIGDSDTDSREIDDRGYSAWLRLDDEDRRRRMLGLAARLAAAKPPRVSLIMIVRNDPEHVVEASIAALNAQMFTGWQLCVIDAASTAPHVAGMCARLTDDGRIRTRRESTPDWTRALSTAMTIADGTLIGLLNPGERLTPDALGELALLFHEGHGLALAYADEDLIDEGGTRSTPRFKSGWSPDLLLADPNAIGRPWLMRRSVLDSVDGLSHRFEGAKEYDLLLRATRLLSDDQIRHMPQMLLHRPPVERRSATSAAQAALEAAKREDAAVRLLPQQVGHWFAWSHRPKYVSVIIPTRDRADLLAGAAAAVLAEDGLDLELFIVDNGSQERETAQLFEKLREHSNVRILSRPGPFNWSALNNAAAAEARGDVLLFLNNDIAAIEKGWLAPLVAEAMRPSIGVVGAKLLYANDTIQHAGMWFGRESAPIHLLRYADSSDDGYLGQLALPRNLMAVTGACIAMRRSVFAEIGGMDEQFPVTFNDVDLCLRVRSAGYRVLWTPFVRLYHLEAATRGDPNSSARLLREQDAFRQFRAVWGAQLGRDPYFNANLDVGPEGRLILVSPQRPA